MDISTKQIDCIKKTEILQHRDFEICERERKLIELEREYNERLEQLIIKEKAIEREQEDGRKVSILKNHVNGIGYKDSKIIAVPHGYISDTKDALDKYKKEYSDYWITKMGDANYSLDESTEYNEEE